MIFTVLIFLTSSVLVSLLIYSPCFEKGKETLFLGLVVLEQSFFLLASNIYSFRSESTLAGFSELYMACAVVRTPEGS